MHEHSPPDAIFALGLDGLRQPDVEVWSAWREDRIAGVGALRKLSPDQGEIKSMRTHPDHVRQGIADAILGTIIERARDLGMKRLSLETGSGAGFDAAIAFYRSRGFREGEAFGDYVRSDFNQFFHRAL
ncbi:N-acetyltransferase [Alteriqipengyuania lutimaris]|uniref:N-acetyltransferase n=2 Tax=Alteriqipengyuania lutimaris TaxID=1538146 RepID=A0A395LGT9_9SPHN|nr:GNAT family N-acetyltransferase [Alteriqipengyuania lutimaris]RDS76118.1 N-acetyltransferase [Alteriqipengyuania lutimaris]